MKLATLARPPSGRVALVLDDEVLDLGLAGRILPLANWIPATLPGLLAGGDDGLAIVRQINARVATASSFLLDDLRAEHALLPLATTRLLAPAPAPGLLLSHARAYRDHVAEMAENTDKGDVPAEYPIGFAKNPHAVIGPGAPIILPPSAPAMVDFEGEISVVFAKACHGISAAEAMGHLLGFTIVNDVSARDWVHEMKAFPDRNRMGKQFPGFAPMGPWIATIDEFADPLDLHLITRVNGQVMQDARTTELIWALPDLIAYYARWYAFQPGDVLTTGSPAGVGHGRNPKIYLKPGDVIDITVDGLGTLSNPVSAQPKGLPTSAMENSRVQPVH